MQRLAFETGHARIRRCLRLKSTANHETVVLKLSVNELALIGPFAVLRAQCLKFPLAKLTDLYYSDDNPQIKMGRELFLLLCAPAWLSVASLTTLLQLRFFKGRA